MDKLALTEIERHYVSIEADLVFYDFHESIGSELQKEESSKIIEDDEDL